MRSRWLWLVTALACNGASSRAANTGNGGTHHAGTDPNEGDGRDSAKPNDPDEAHGGASSGADLRLLALLGPLTDGTNLRAWSHPSGRKFAMTTQQKPAHLLTSLVTLPKATVVTRETDRVLAVTNVWTASRAGVTRAARFVVGSGQVECDEAPCLTVELDVQPEADGSLSVSDERCADQLAAYRAKPTDGTALDAFDRAVIPAICANATHWSWSGTKFEKKAAQRAHAGAVAVGAPIAISSGVDAAALLVAPIAEGSLGEFLPTTIWHPSGDDLTTSFGLVERLEASQDSSLRQSKPGKPDANGARAVASHEIWVADGNGMRRAFSAPTGIRALACVPSLPSQPGKIPPPPDTSREGRCVVFELTARVVEGAIVIEDRDNECTAQPKTLDAWDKLSVAKICSQRGRYTWDGREFVRSVRTRVGMLKTSPRHVSGDRFRSTT